MMLVRKLREEPYEDKRYAIGILITVFSQYRRPSFAALGSKNLNFDETAVICHGGPARSRKEVEATCLDTLSFVQYPVLFVVPSVAGLTQRACDGARGLGSRIYSTVGDVSAVHKNLEVQVAWWFGYLAERVMNSELSAYNWCQRAPVK
jgi:hypothetical protein